MKRLIVSYLCLCCMMAIHAQDYTPTCDVQETDSGIVVTYHFHGGIIQDDPLHPGAKFWKIPGFALNTHVGEPAFPSRWDTFVIPEGVNPVIEVIDSTYMDTPFVMAPAYPCLSMSDTVGYTSERVPNITPFFGHLPIQIVKTGRLRNYRGQNLLNVGIAPVQYDFDNRNARAYSMVRYIIRWDDSAKRNMSDKDVDIQEVDPFLANITLNGSLTHNSSRQKSQALDSTAMLDKHYYLIISTPKYKEAVERFAEWKSTMGFNVVTCGISGSAYTNNYVWNDERILSCINNVREWTGDTLRYVLFVGDEQSIPGHQCHYEIESVIPTLPDIYNFSSDYYYECLGDPVNNAPTLRIGRIPVSTNAEAEHVFDKIISYEAMPSDSESFYRTTVSSAVFDGGSANSNYQHIERGMAVYASEQIIIYLEDSIDSPMDAKRIYLNVFNHPAPSFWQFSKLFSQGDPIPSYLHEASVWTGNYQNVIDSINAGTLIYSYIGHGSNTEWINRELDSQDVILFSEEYIDSLNNSNNYPVLFSMSCHTGEYHHTSNCPAEFFLKKEHAGAVAVIAPSSTTYMGFTEYLDEGFFNAVWPNPGINQSHPLSGANYELGDILAVSKEWIGYMQVYDDTLQTSMSMLSDEADKYKFTLDAFHLFGDPSMQIYTEKPSHFTDAYLEMSEGTITVHTGEVGSRITFYSPTQVDERQRVTSYMGSDVSYTFDPDNVDTLYVCITKHNFVPAVLKYVYDSTIQNETLTSHQVYLSHIIDMGSNVTLSKPEGNAVVAPSGRVVFKGGTVTLHPGTIIQSGAQVSINPRQVKFYPF